MCHIRRIIYTTHYVFYLWTITMCKSKRCLDKTSKIVRHGTIGTFEKQVNIKFTNKGIKMKPKARVKTNPKARRLMGDSKYLNLLDEVKCNEICLDRVPHEYLTEELCLAALSHSGITSI